MWTSRRLSIILLLTIFSLACFTPDVDEGEVNKLRPEVNENANVNIDPNANVAEDNETELNSLINLPFEPDENVYREDTVGKSANTNRVPGPTDRKITAVLKFSKENTEKLLDQLKESGNSFESKIESEPWFPAELIAKSQTTGDATIKGTGYKADIFFKTPFNSGTLMRVNDTDYFILTLQTQ